MALKPFGLMDGHGSQVLENENWAFQFEGSVSKTALGNDLHSSSLLSDFFLYILLYNSFYLQSILLSYVQKEI